MGTGDDGRTWQRLCGPCLVEPGICSVCLALPYYTALSTNVGDVKSLRRGRAQTDHGAVNT